jgi:hypothetical protein
MRSYTIFAINCFLALILIRAPAAPQATVTLAPSDDAYVDIARPTTNLDGGGLNVALSNNPEPPPPATVSKRVFLKFSLAGVSFAIAQARLSLSALSDTACGGPPDAVNVAVLAVENDAWTETSLKWSNQPAAGAQLDTLDSGAVSGPGYHTWTDAGADGLAAWLRSQQTLNGGDNVASLALVITGTTATTGVIFEDREGVGGSLGCTGGGLLPVLIVATSAAPLAINDLAAAKTGDKIVLTWSPVTRDVNGQSANVVRYAIYRRANDPYFIPTPGDLLTTTSQTTYADPHALGAVGISNFYVVTAIDSLDHESAPSNRVGEIEFAIE